MLNVSTPCSNERSSNKGSTASAGFSVLEAIIAIAILAVAFLPLLALQQQMGRNTIAFQRSEELMEVKRSALSYVRALNPMRDPSGDLNLGQVNMHWNAVPISAVLPARDGAGNAGRFVVALYNVEVTLTFANQRTQVFSVHSTGWRASKPYLSGF